MEATIMERTAPATQPLAKRIHKLDQTVVNKIAAGEVIVRPANALKELLENSLDAGSTLINITVKTGGLDFLQIQDNGHGIHKDDLPLACERFATSKISHFEDLSHLNSFGFRGEALASISYVAKIKILSRTADSHVAYQAEFSNGKIMGQAKPTAGSVGTTITVENLFYNNPSRRAAMSSPSEETAKIAEVVMKYAMQYPKVGFSLKKQGQHVHDIRTPPNSTTLENAKILFGSSLAKELIEVEGNLEKMNVKFSGLVSHANYSSKKYNCLFFINNRALNIPKLKKTLEAFYDSLLPKNTFPFIYLSIDLPPAFVDVNIHPSKAEVRFRFEEEIVKFIVERITECLHQHDKSRSFSTTLLSPTLPVALSRSKSILSASIAPSEDSFLSQASTIRPPSKLAPTKNVRTDSRMQTLDSFFRPKTSMEDVDPEDCQSLVSSLPTMKHPRELRFRSLLEMRAEIEDQMDEDLRRIFANHVFVGVASENMALFQHDVDLYAVDITRLSAELFYQLIIYNFANFGSIKLTSPLSVSSLIGIALANDAEGAVEDVDLRKQLSDRAAKVLLEKAEMLADYFSLQFTERGELLRLPLLLGDHLPPFAELPSYLARLAAEVEWTKEKACFQTLARVTAEFYALKKDYYLEEADKNGGDKWKWTVQHVLFPAVKSMLIPPKSMRSNGILVKLTNLPELYKVFERC